MLILTFFWVTLVALIKASMVMLGIGMAFFVFSSFILFAFYSAIAGAFSSKTVQGGIST